MADYAQQWREAWQSLQGMAVPSAQDIQQRDAQSTVNHYNPFSPYVAGAPQKPRVYDSSDALLGEMLREVLHMAKAMEAMRGEIADLRAEIMDKAQTQQGAVVAFPAGALRHGTPT